MTEKPLSAGMQAILNKTMQVKSSIDQAQTERSPLRQLPLDQLRASPFQARLDFTDIDSLAEDIGLNGVLQPVLVRLLGPDTFELVAGERRWRAARLAGLDRIPAIVRNMDDTQARLYGLKENLERQDLNAYEVAHAAVDLVALAVDQPREQVIADLQARRSTSPEVTQALQEALSVLGRDLSVAGFQRHYLKMLSLPEHLKDAIQQGASYAAVMALTKASLEQQAEWLPLVISSKWGTRDVEQALKTARSTSPSDSLQPTDPVQAGERLAKQLRAGRLEQLDGRRRRKAQRLLEELTALLEQEA
ncbi:ParB/RepB/Spo0J family partition protein [Deinococcus radiophilus]|uniref:ParB/RepB/Spo0J family partition protein n=1 Tax=Deinococcus radiophilus TaxID=32062 RepID=A0A3S0JLQ2_9DEIO|nr:ParB/RepB/Spo0J family partition protein [Deinococcus radiophilus]RTR24208.1 ParB/RepB/Spo0J family partition protein [Deinococcus radiophilus]UFA51881.1 ParB/RepB/Spo0J family partition protein [Deinococcus radiophilus]